MKRKLLFALALLVSGVCNLWAQTDVTSTYITNAGFDACTAESSDVAAKTIRNYSSNGWTNANTGSFTTIAVTAYGGGKKVGGSTTPSTKKDGTTVSGNTLGIIAGWADEVKIQSGEITLLAGVYTLTVDHYLTSSTNNYGNSSSRFGFVTSSTSYLVSSTTFTASTWTTETVTFTLTESTTGKIQLGLKGNNNAGSGAPAVFYDDVKLTYIPFADATDYANLNSAISTVEGKAWGFDADEYAPYNYVEVLTALANAKAIDQNANNLQTEVQTKTSALNTVFGNTTFTANVEEVNAIWDPSFEHEYSTSGNVQPIAWTGTTNHDNATDVRWMWNVGSNAGLNATSSTKALFTKYGVHYGQQEGYTLPLNANTYYTVAFVYGGWSDCKKDGYVTMADPSSTNLSLIPSSDLPLDAVDGNSNSDSWKNYQAFFKTNAAGNYVLGLRKKDESKQSQYVYGDFVLKITTLAEATTYYNSVKTSVEGDYDDSAYGGDEKTAFKNALDASMEGKSVAEIFAAASDLQTKHDTYVAAKPNYAKFIAEKNSAIAIGVTSETANAVTMSTKDDLETALQALYVLEDAAATSGYGVNATTLFGSWTTQNMDTKSGEHWSGDASRTYYDRWQNSGFTSSITSTMTLPAGKYVFKVAARAQQGGINGAFNMSVKVGDAAAVQKDFVAKSATGYGIETSGVANYSAGGTYANTTGRGWEWRFIGFELNESASVTMAAYAQILANNWVGFSDATLLTTSDNVGVLKNLLEAELTVANGISTTANVGTGVFQIPSSAATTFEGAKTTAQGVYDNTDATSEQVSDAITALQTAEETYKNAELNAPADGARYRIKSTAATGASWKDKYYMLRPDASQANGGYSTKADVSAADYLAIAWKFTAVTGGYTLSMTDADGATRYLCTNIKGYGQGTATQIRTTTDSEKALVVKVIAATGTDGRWFLQNTEDNSYLGGQDAGLFSNSQNYDLAIEEASQASVTVSCKAGKYGTVIFPFTPDVSTGFDGITFYSCESVHPVSNRVQIVEVTTLEANVPYLIQNDGAENFSQVVTGWGTATVDSYTEDLLTGVYTNANINGDNRYVLQTPTDGENVGVQAFYKVNDEFTATPYKCYLTYDASNSVKALFLGFGDADAIRSIENESSMFNVESSKVYNLAGQRLQKLQKGINIVNGKKVLVK